MSTELIDLMTPGMIKGAIDDALSRRPYVGHIRLNAATMARVREMSLEAPTTPWPRMPMGNVDLVLDETVHDGFLRVAEHPSVRDRPIGDPAIGGGGS